MSDQNCAHRETAGARRMFLRSVVATSSGVAVLAALPGGAVVAASPPTETEPAAADAGYRETRHIRDYYRTAAL